MDGRQSNAVLATPGGDAGEFILALFVYEGMIADKKIELDLEKIMGMFKNYLANMVQE